MDSLLQFFDFARLGWALVANTWWILIPPALFYAGKELWRFYLKTHYFANLEWKVLDVRIPREIAKTPEAMEQVFAGLQALYWEFDPMETWWEGLQHDYLIFEMASLGGEVHFFIRVPAFYKNLVESLLYAQYPEAEVAEVPDYMNDLPQEVPSRDWDLFGVEFNLAKADAYPIRVYRDFLSMSPGEEEFVKVDPFSAIAEVMGKVRPGEYMFYHILFKPTGDERWKEEGQALVEKLTGRKAPEKKNAFNLGEMVEPLTSGWGDVFRSVLGRTSEESLPPEKKKEERPMSFLPPDIDDQVKAINRNISKPGFAAFIRFAYVARRDIFSMSHISSFIGSLKQYNTLSLNALKLNGASLASNVPWWWLPFMQRKRKAGKKRTFYYYLRHRKPFTDTIHLKSKPIVLNSEELATIYHYPGLGTKAPMMPRIPSRRGEPPPALPI